MESAKLIGMRRIYVVSCIAVVLLLVFCLTNALVRYHSTGGSGISLGNNSASSTVQRVFTATSPAAFYSCDEAVLSGNSSSSEAKSAQSSELNSLYTPLIKLYGMTLEAEPIIADDQVYFDAISYGSSLSWALYRATTTAVETGRAVPELLATLPSPEVALVLDIRSTNDVVAYELAKHASTRSPGGDYAVYAIDATEGADLWQVTSTTKITPYLSGDGAYLSSDAGLTKLDMRNGKILWQFAKGQSLPFFFKKMVYVGGEPGSSSTQSEIYQLDDSTGRVLRDYPIEFDQVQAWDQCGDAVYFERGEGMSRISVGRLDLETGAVQYIGSTIDQ
jgi:hypothetical protein